MPDSGNAHCQKLAENIRDIFQSGLHISDTDSHFILSTMSIDHLNQIDRVIQDPDSPDYEVLMALIYFPDESIQISLEDQIESACFQPQDLDSILTHLMPLKPDTRILSPKKQLLLTITTPPSSSRAFLQRLNLNRHLAPELIQAIEQRMDPIVATKYKVWIRNMTREPNTRDIHFLKDLFLNLDPPYQARDRLIDFVLRFLEETPAAVEPIQGLTQYKHRCLQHIQRLDRYESKRRNYNFETRMALGIREPHDDKKALMQKVVFLDEIGLALYNRNI